MTSTSAIAVALALLAGFVGGAMADHGPKVDLSAMRTTTIAPAAPSPSPKATIQYQSGWKASDGASRAGQHLHYCVIPFINITSAQELNTGMEPRRPPAWNLAFDLALVDATGAVVLSPVTVPTPIPANTTRELIPPQRWCVEIRGATAPPELYLQVEGRRARVIFDPQTPRATPR